MRLFIPATLLLLILSLASAAFAQDTERPDVTIEKMSIKLARGVANLTTCLAEVPKQIYLTSQEEGKTAAAIIGPLKGIGMTLYRGFIGATETVFFMVPQPGYYNPMIDPELVWEGWDKTRSERGKVKESAANEAPAATKGE